MTMMMTDSKLTIRIFCTAEALALAGALGAAAWLSTAQEWQPLLLVGLLLALSLGGQRLVFTIRGQHLSAGFVAQVLAISLLGPAPAVAIALAAAIFISVGRQLPLSAWLTNLAAFAVFPLIGGLLVQASIGNVHDPSNQLAHEVTFGLVVFAVFMITNALNFSVIALDNHFVENRRLIGQVRELFVPMLPGQIAAGALTAVLAVAYINLGLPVLFGSVLVIVIFQYLMVALLRSEDRADQLEARSVHLASLQLGVLTTLVETLALRDRMTARHAAAVARYARALASEIDCDEADQDLVHTAGLLHDIGKFALPDSILQRGGAVRRGLGGDPSPSAGRCDARRAPRRLRAGRGRDPLPPRAHRRQRLPGRADRQRDPAALAHHRGVLDLRHADRA